MLGTAAVPTRLFYQGLAAAALAAACVMIWRRTRSAGAVAFLALNPVVALYLVNGGRNDILVGVAILAAVTFAARGRDTAAGIAAGMGVLIKLTGLVGLVALVASTAATRGKRPATRVTLASAGVLAMGYAIVGVHALFTPLQTAGARFSAGSLWRLLPRVGLRLPSPHFVLAVLAVIVALVIARTARAGSAACVTAALTTLTAGAAYTLAGYAGWALPTAALDHEGRVASARGRRGRAARRGVRSHPSSVRRLDRREPHDARGVRRPARDARDPAAGRPRRADADDGPGALAAPTSPGGSHGRMNRARSLSSRRSTSATTSRACSAARWAALPGARILVIDDGSRDGTPQCALELGDRLGGVDVVRRVGATGARRRLPRRLPPSASTAATT